MIIILSFYLRSGHNRVGKCLAPKYYSSRSNICPLPCFTNPGNVSTVSETIPDVPGNILRHPKYKLEKGEGPPTTAEVH